MPALSLTSISRRFGEVQALDGVDFSLDAGSVHALLGENGAGKSTLMHIAYGMLPADRGEILVDGIPVAVRSPRDARRLGIGMVHQHFMLVDTMTVQENLDLSLGRRQGRAVTAPESAADEGTSLVTHRLDSGALVETLSVAQKQRLEIAKARAAGARILLLDEPTAVLAPSEIEALLAELRWFADAGGAVVLITHKLGEVLACADQVTVLRQGRVTLDGSVAGRTEEELAGAMVGEVVAGGWRLAGGGVASGRGAEERVESVVARAERAPRAAHLPLTPGRILGVAAVEGNGHRELLRALAADPAVAFIPEDRGQEGLIGELSVTENLVLGLGARAHGVKGRLVDWRAARVRAAELMREFDVRGAGPDAPVRSLSGGNQQKLVLARAFASHPVTLVADNPTRGLDIRATAEVHRRLRQAASNGVAVVVWSSDLDEVLTLADKVVVVRRGAVIRMPPGATRMEVGQAMLGAAREG